MPAKSKKNPKKYNDGIQYYKGVPVRLIVYTEEHFARLKAKRFLLGTGTNPQNVWIPNRFLDETGTILPHVDIDFVFKQAYNQNKFRYAGIDVNPYDWAPAR